VRRLALLLGCFALVATACGAKPSGPSAIPDVTPAAFRAKLATFRGKPLVVNFWATWCDPCKEEMPRLAAAAKKYAGRVAFLGVDVQDDSAVASKFAAKQGVTYGSVADPRRDVVQSQAILGLPVTQFYAANGKRVAVHQGELKADVLANQIRTLLRRA
jgi:cytochrome c biogenesis protein CcmG, thiol:disulfide interchange protein DsbE